MGFLVPWGLFSPLFPFGFTFLRRARGDEMRRYVLFGTRASAFALNAHWLSINNLSTLGPLPIFGIIRGLIGLMENSTCRVDMSQSTNS